MLNSNSSAETAADSSTQPIANSSADIEANPMLYAGLGRIEVEIVEYPISDRYCSKGLVCTLDTTNSQIRCSGAWFSFDDRWVVKLCV